MRLFEFELWTIVTPFDESVTIESVDLQSLGQPMGRWRPSFLPLIFTD